MNKKIYDEMADIFILLVSLSKRMNIDLEKSIYNKLRKNRDKYPVEKCYGSAKKYNELD